jgi:hypothetical protein
MSRTKSNHEASGALSRARQAAAQVKPARAVVKTLAGSAGTAARRRVHKTRAWAAPQVDRTGQVWQDGVAPNVSAALSSAAGWLEPAKPNHRRWRKLVGISILTAAASALAALVRNRAKPELAPWPDTNPEEIAPAGRMSDENARASTDAEVDGQVRTS